MRSSLAAALVALAACGGEDEPAPKSDASSSSTGAGAAGGGGSGGGACSAPTGIDVTGDPIPGRDLQLALQAGGGGTTAWSVSVGAVSPQGSSAVWTLPDDIAVHVPETVTATAVWSAPGCADVPLTADVVVDWPLELRTIVISNPNAPGSVDVADHYATFRAVPAENRCEVPASDPTVLPGAELDAWIDAVMACVASVGEHVHYLVPVWGVPYKVSGRIDDLAPPGVNKVTVSLDALLAYGSAAKSLEEPFYNPLYQQGTSTTATYDPWIPFGVLREREGDELFLVARIDGADADAAKALVDRTAAAEQLARAGMLDGIVYVDGNRGIPHPTTDAFGSYESGEWNIIGVESVFTALGTYDVVANYDAEEFGTAPAPLSCPDALYYAGWYSFGNYNDVFTWLPGAIGGHLDSCSACDIRGDKDWSARALRKGITATFGAVNEPYVAGMPEYDQFFLYLTQGGTYGEAGYESTRIGAWMMVWVGDPLYRPYPPG